MPDKMIQCKDCGATFAFTEEDQAFFRERGYENEPQRCMTCRAARRTSRSGQGRESFPVVCAACGKETTVPFKPTNDKPVYCKECYQARGR